MGGSAMAGLFDRLARQVLSSLGQRKTTQSKSKTVVVKPVKAVVPTIVPKVNTKKDDAKIIDAWEKKMTTENITVENIPENSKTVDYVVADDIPAPVRSSQMQTPHPCTEAEQAARRIRTQFLQPPHPETD